MKMSCVRHLAVAFLIVLSVSMMFGCAATQVAIEKRNLDVQTKMSETIFLDPVAPEKKTVFIDVKNTSDKEIEIAPELCAALAKREYRSQTKRRLLHDPGEYPLRGKMDPHCSRSSGWLWRGRRSENGRRMGCHDRAGGMGAGAHRGSRGARGSVVKDVMYAMITDVQISERSAATVTQVVVSNLSQGTQSTIQQQSEGTVNWKRYRTRIGTSANQVNLKFEDAIPEIKNGLCKSIGGVF
jgi:hypothetical protein